jgi:formylglycine-generating enzyme required for sulfatase activity
MPSFEELLLKLEERFIMGEISEKVYLDLKAKYEGMVKDGNISAGGGVNLGDTGMIKDSNISSTTNIENKDNKGGDAVGGNQTINIGGEGSQLTKSGENCPVCGKIVKDDYFKCGKCGRNYMCLKHQDEETFCCHQCLDEVKKDNARKAEQERQKVESEKREKADAYFKEAEKLLADDKYSEAMILFKKTLELNPEHKVARKIIDSKSPVTINEKDKSELILIPPGEFLMGAGDDDQEALDNEKPPHKVCLDDYYISKYPVTVAQYRIFCKKTGQQMPEEPTWGWMDDDPIVRVYWDNAVAYCKWAGGRLPTEAEWEKAARGTDERVYPWGNDVPDSDYANYDEMVGEATSVGKYPNGASPYGVLDMAGNVYEWCSDWYDGDYYNDSPEHNPKGPRSGSDRVIRGGSWFYEPRCLRASSRDGSTPGYSDFDHGFRLARTP